MKKRRGEIAFDKAQTAYTNFENSLWARLGRFGKWVKKRRDKQLDEPDWKRLNKIWIWIVILAFVVGCLISGKYYEYQCNKHIVETFYPEESCRMGLKCNISNFVNLGNESILSSLPLLGTNEGEIT